ncbi:adenylate/guanylate cyclase domain-containing protein [uncultured Thiothrix sp.]|uniref:adenylate/guanylate cyclase domain-containing protein n=1 Tax=uncultured Thiothrix sp. TaxID=223185 RepID=UPI00260A9AFF|nr:adenylate/guanylate cyclase domain-containing protein [uncultured Thiothrix sp.]
MKKLFLTSIGLPINEVKKLFQLRFTSTELENKFLEYEGGNRLIGIRAAITILIVLIMLFSRFDFEYGGSRWYITFLIRLLGPVTILIIWFAISYSSLYQRNARLYDFLFATAAMSLTVFLSFSLGYLFEVPFVDWSFPFLANSMLIVFYTGLLLIISFFYFALFLLLISLTFEFCLLQLTADQAAITEINQNFGATIVMALVANRGLEKLRRVVFQRNFMIMAERERANALLYDLVPESVAHRLKNGEVVADEHHNLVVIFIDIVGFTQFSAHARTDLMLDTLKAIFTSIDNCASKHKIEKVKTIGDGYMAVSHHTSLATEEFENVYAAADFCLEVIDLSKKIFAEMDSPLSLRVGLHMGSAFGGVLGTNRPFYDYWGTTINIAAHLEKQSEPNKISVSTVVRDLLIDRCKFIDRGQVACKGIGFTQVWFLERKRQ